jgi:hypothetical protein
MDGARMRWVWPGHECDGIAIVELLEDWALPLKVRNPICNPLAPIRIDICARAW